ncbi:9027_t:CDS:2 [Entrophospora sp. SA101]|nr:9027_t:CDS:2 [Entrophospora sp. SA101]
MGGAILPSCWGLTEMKICHLLECTSSWHITIYDLENYDLALLYDDDDYRKLSLKDLRKLLKIPYNRERSENASRKMLEDVQAFLKRQQDTKDYTLDAK